MTLAEAVAERVGLDVAELTVTIPEWIVQEAMTVWQGKQ